MKQFKTLVGLLLLTITVQAKVHSVKYWEDIYINLSVQQKSLLIRTFIKAKEYNLEYSLTAIALKESLAGKYKISISSIDSIDVGVFQINSKNYLRKNNIRKNNWNTARAIETLLDYETNFIEARNILQECLKKSRGNYKKSYELYNGWTSGSKRSIDYSKDIVNIIKVLKKYLRFKK